METNATNGDASLLLPALTQFHQYNPSLRCKQVKDGFEIRGLWGLSDLYLSFTEPTSELVEALNCVRFDDRFDAIIHLDRGEVEFIFAFVDPNNSNVQGFIDRSFQLAFMSKNYDCRFAEPTSRLFTIAKHFRRIPSDSSQQTVPQLNAFRDWHRRSELSERTQKFFEGKLPRSFFVSSIDESIDFPQLFRHINRLTQYYDRHNPQIIIREKRSEAEEEEKHPIRYLKSEFPKHLAIRPIDDVILTLLEVGCSSAPRSAYLYFYQVLEYAGYFYTDDKIKGRLKQILRDPAILCCDDDKISELFDTLMDYHHADDVKIQRVIEENVDMRNVWKDVWNDQEFFSEAVTFEGGFVAEALISADTTESAWKTLAIPKLFKVLTQIRNVIVHAREKRENKVILPTSTNSKLLRRYIPILRRISEEVAFRS